MRFVTFCFLFAAVSQAGLISTVGLSKSEAVKQIRPTSSLVPRAGGSGGHGDPPAGAGGHSVGSTGGGSAAGGGKASSDETAGATDGGLTAGESSQGRSGGLTDGQTAAAVKGTADKPPPDHQDSATGGGKSSDHSNLDPDHATVNEEGILTISASIANEVDSDIESMPGLVCRRAGQCGKQWPCQSIQLHEEVAVALLTLRR